MSQVVRAESAAVLAPRVLRSHTPARWRGGGADGAAAVAAAGGLERPPRDEMSARLPLMLLLAALSAFPPFAGAQGDPLPLALVDLVMSSSIGSIKDLQQLLLTDSVDVQVAQQAQCKVRTEVMEVTRSMLDRRNANFVVWPPCVEVQRCSGCCNARTIKCVPTVISTRQLQVMKIQFVNKQKHYEKVVISVEDHVECRCQTAPPQLAPRTTARKPQHSQRPPAAPPEGPHLKTQSKQEIHRHDELKQNQNVQLKDLGLQGHQIQVKHPHTETPVTHGKEEAPFKQTPSGGQQMQDSTTQRPVEEREPRQKQGSDQHLSFTEEGGPHLQGLNSLQRHNHMQQEVGDRGSRHKAASTHIGRSPHPPAPLSAQLVTQAKVEAQEQEEDEQGNHEGDIDVECPKEVVMWMFLKHGAKSTVAEARGHSEDLLKNGLTDGH
ncbi:hypothetical protein Z043_110564 [Scleropages formosus]|uniref:Platelet-derived growth factor subunit B n=1 Tax=Scleropages formosus TaxID=113540 RepID=A0A0P7VBR6_SCLFO|nr:hypothetical protein Z043_110564 [Scleropages formosus]